MCMMLSIMMMMLLIMRLMLMLMPMMTISVLGCSANGLEANQSGTYKAQCANKLLSTHLPGELGNTTPSSSFPSPSPLSSSSTCADTVIGIEQKQSSSLWLISKAIFVCYSYHFPPPLPLYSPSISLLVLDILNAANLHISRLGALVHNTKSLADRTLPGH